MIDEDDMWNDYDPDDEPIDGVGFAQPGANSALRAETKDNPRNLPCPTCGWPNRLTPIDKARGYQCDSCANAQERGMDINYYEGDDDEEEKLYSVCCLVQVDVLATSEEDAKQKVVESHSNWTNWSAGPARSVDIVNTDP